MSPRSVPLALMPRMVTPVTVSLFMSAVWMGLAPRYLGRRDGWTLSWREGSKMERSEGGRMEPKEAVTRREVGRGERNCSGG